LRAVRAFSPQAEVAFLQVPDNYDLWAIKVSVGAVTIFQTRASFPKEVICEAEDKLERMSQQALRTLHAASDDDIPPDSELTRKG
jgi:hypothetical protein